MPIPDYAVLLLSGGLDSVVLAYLMRSEDVRLHALLFDYRQRHVQELVWARDHCRRLGILYTTIELPQLRGSALTDGHGGAVVPNRNAIFLSHAVNLAVEAQAETVLIGCNAGDAENFPDCRLAFIAAYNATLQAAEIPVQVVAPFIGRSKAWIARLGSDLGVALTETWSCYRGGAQPCGKCEACLKRAEALAA